MSRLFLGLEIPDPVKRLIHETLKPLQITTKGWEHPHDYHQTLFFFGEATPEELESIKEDLSKILFPPFRMTLTQVTFFPRRVMYVGVEPSATLSDLKSQLDARFDRWINPHAKPFLPHVTVKRFQRYEQPALLQGLDGITFPKVFFDVHTIALFESKKDSENRKYHVIHRGPPQE